VTPWREGQLVGALVAVASALVMACAYVLVVVKGY
jgi:hypothetical protein